jgi:hypothetical protein
LQYLIAVFLIEYIMGCFWFPLEAAVLALLPKTASLVEQFFAHHDIVCHLPCDFLKREGTGMFISYFLSFLILLAAMHATRIINLKLLARLVYSYSRLFNDLKDVTQLVPSSLVCR